jgi:uncharacterized phiE125 gp8 family phage protein|tara:strand:+ start:1184 stop:1762 length:579 start_codon:yes stop_codon:yes gene_type:complete
MRTYQVVTPASTYPVSLTETKLHLKVDINTDDTLITNLIIAATQVSEEYTNRFFIVTTLSQTCTTFRELKSLFKSKVMAIGHVKYYDDTNTQQTLLSTNYVLNNEFEPGQVNPVVDYDYPSTVDRIDAVECEYKVGYGQTAADVPDAIKQAILLTIGNWYENRQSIITGKTSTELSMSAKWLLDTYKVQVLI